MGNQLFQYALGRNLSTKNRGELKFETSYFQKGARAYALGKFNIPESSSGISKESDLQVIGVPRVLDKSLFGRAERKFFRITEYFKPIYKKKFIIEPYFHFCPNILKIEANCYLSGVWQSEKYFKDSESIIRKELTLKDPLTTEARDWIQKMAESDSVSIHIRRGDYVNSLKTNQFHGICSLEYYHNAIKLISQKITSPVFFIFSDDIDWVKDNLNIIYPVFYVSGEMLPDHEELMIMSKCKHNIIANSSFSWWGAWLNENKTKIVIAPKKWFNTKTVDTVDLIPSSWIKI